MCAQYRIYITRGEEEEEEEEEETWIDNGEDLNRPHIFTRSCCCSCWESMRLLLLRSYHFSTTATATTADGRKQSLVGCKYLISFSFFPRPSGRDIKHSSSLVWFLFCLSLMIFLTDGDLGEEERWRGIH